MAPALRPAKLAALLAAVAACAAFAAPASANYEDLLLDACGRDGKVDGTYSQKDYREALANIPADADQYSDCRAIIKAAQLAAASGQDILTPAAAEAILATATPEELQAIDEAVKSSTGNPVQVGDEVVSPASYGAGRKVAAGISELPTPLKAALGLLAVGALAALLTAIVPRVRARFSS